MLEYEQLETLLDRPALESFRRNALHPDHPVIRGTAQNPDIYFQEREAGNRFYQALPELVEGYMAQISAITGREYHLFNYSGAADAEWVIIAMGSVCDTVQEVVETLNAAGEKVGFAQRAPVPPLFAGALLCSAADIRPAHCRTRSY
nr:pyruvate-flavodoxin oxidoreductase [Raoultella sp. NCTC 9187]